MKTRIPTLLALGVSLASGTAALADFEQIRSEKDFRTLVVGKTIESDQSTIVMNADGTFRGKTTDGRKIVGNWAWSGRWWCRNVTVGKQNLGQNCQKMEIDGDRLRATRDKGKGVVIDNVLR